MYLRKYIVIDPLDFFSWEICRMFCWLREMCWIDCHNWQYVLVLLLLPLNIYHTIFSVSIVEVLVSCLHNLQTYILQDLNIINIPLFDTFWGNLPWGHLKHYVMYISRCTNFYANILILIWFSYLRSYFG